MSTNLHRKYLKYSGNYEYGVPVITDGNYGFILGSDVLEEYNNSLNYIIIDASKLGNLKFFGSNEALLQLEGELIYKTYADISNTIHLIDPDGRLLITGSNRYGKLGLSLTTEGSLNVFGQTNEMYSIKKIVNTYSQSFILTNNGDLLIAGNNTNNIFLNENITKLSVFYHLMSNIKDVAGTAYGSDCSVAVIKTDGTLWVNGGNSKGQLGTGDQVAVVGWQQIGTDMDWDKVFMGYNSTFIIKSDGTLWRSGYNHYGTLGSGNAVDITTFTKLNNDTDWIKVASYLNTLILKSNGDVYGCGYNNNGELGLTHAMQVNNATKLNIDDVKDVSVLGMGGLCLKNNGEVYSSGKNTQGSLGFSYVDQTIRNWTLVASNILSITNGMYLLIMIEKVV